MKREWIAIALFSGLSVAAAPAPQAPADVAVPAPSVMTGTIEQRNAAIEKALTAGGGRVDQMNVDNVGISQVVRLLSLQTKIDIRIDWDSLEKQEIKKDAATSFALYSVSPGAALRAMLWKLHPKSGSMGYAAQNGELVIAAQAAPTPYAETDDDKTHDKETAKKLGEAMDIAQIRGKELSANALLLQIAFAKKIGIIMDWDELATVGVNPDATQTINNAPPTVEALLQVVLSGMKPSKGAVSYDIREGILRISTDERLKALHALEKPAATGLP